MNHFRGKLLDGEKVFVEPLNVYIQFHPSTTGSRSGWYGYFLLPEGVKVAPGSDYRLILADGRTGDLKVEELSEDETGRPRAMFVGDGDL
jgi:hypothetical protein